jgi:hypothetical protein
MRVMVTHDVDDVRHWLGSPKRDEFFHAHGMTVRTFTDPDGGNRVGLVIENVPDMATLQAALETEQAAAAMRHDGVHPDSIVMWVES